MGHFGLYVLCGNKTDLNVGGKQQICKKDEISFLAS